MSGWRILSVRPGGPKLTPTGLAELAMLREASGPVLLVFPADAVGEALAGATAAACGAAVLGRMTALSRGRGDRGDLVVTRSSHGGRGAIMVRPVLDLAVATAHGPSEGDGEIVLGSSEEPVPDRTPLADQPVALEQASVVLGGGRGLDDAGFPLLERIARAIGGAVGASLPAIDLGLAPVSRQIGQSGKFITPRLYLAIGLSGTPQHLAGIGSSTRLLAINHDPDAAIFRFAEAGAIADARALLPVLADVLERQLAERPARGPVRGAMDP